MSLRTMNIQEKQHFEKCLIGTFLQGMILNKQQIFYFICKNDHQDAKVGSSVFDNKAKYKQQKAVIKQQ